MLFRSDERDLAVWQVVANGLRSLGRLVDGDALDRLRLRVARLVGPVLSDLGWDPVEGEGDLRAKLRGLLVMLLAINGNDVATRERCRILLRTAQADSNAVDPELTAAATTVVATFGDSSDYEDMKGRFQSADTPQERLRYLYALADFDSPELVRRTCEFALGGEVKTQNAPFLLGRCIAKIGRAHV